MSSSAIFLDNVQCTGNETLLLQCSRNVIGDHNCGNISGAGVRCGGIVLAFIIVFGSKPIFCTSTLF